MKPFVELDAWKVGLQLVKEVHLLSKKFPRGERPALVAQMRRSSESILANMAEGCGRYTYADRANKFTIARGECAETEALVLLSSELGFVPQADAKKVLELTRRVGQLLSGLIRKSKPISP